MAAPACEMIVESSNEDITLHTRLTTFYLGAAMAADCMSSLSNGDN